MFHLSHAHFTNCHSIQKRNMDFYDWIHHSWSGHYFRCDYCLQRRTFGLQGLTPPMSDVILLVVLKCQFELINKYHYCIQNPLFHNITCWETCGLPKIHIIFRIMKNQLLVGAAMDKMEGRPII